MILEKRSHQDLFCFRVEQSRTLIKLLVHCFKHSNLVLDTWITEDLQICVSVPLEERDQISMMVYENFDSAAGSLDAAFDVTLKSSELWLLPQPAHYR